MVFFRKRNLRVNEKKLIQNASVGESFLINVVIMALLLLLFVPHFESGVDVWMQSFAYGISGAHTSHLIFSNIILGEILSFLSEFFPAVPWYIVFHYIAVFLSLTLIDHCILKRNKNGTGRLLAVLITVFFGYECYVQPHYMKTAAVLYAAALFYLFCVTQQDEKTSRRQGLIFVLMCAVGSLVSFGMSVITAAIITAGFFLLQIAEGKGIRSLKKMWLPFALAFVLSLGLHIADVLMYQNNTLWREIGTMRSGLEKIWSYGIPEYDEEIWENSTVSAQDYALLKSGTFVPDAFDMQETVRKMVLQYKDSSPVNFLKFFRTMPLKAFQLGMFYCWLSLLLFLTFAERRRRRAAFAIEIVLVILTYLPLYFLEMHGYHWVNTAVFIGLSTVNLLPLADLDESECRYAGVYLALLGLVLYTYFSDGLPTTKTEKKEITECVAALKKDKAGFYSVDIVEMMRLGSVFDSDYKIFSEIDNLYFANGIYQMVPITVQKEIGKNIDRRYRESPYYFILAGGTNENDFIREFQETYLPGSEEHLFLENAAGLKVIQMYPVY